MWRKLQVSLVLGLALVAIGLLYGSFVSAKPKLNLILITLDTTRADHLGCYGDKHALTPTLDKLAERGTVFERAYTTAPFTLPAHASIHTGLYPFKHGLFNNGTSSLNRGIPTLAETLARAEYSTGAFVASFVLDNQFGLSRGFSVYDDAMPAKGEDNHGYPQRRANQVVDAALPWLTLKSAHPFFCWMHFYDPHFDYVDHQETFGDQFVERPYDGEIAFVDQQLQRVIDFLESKKLMDRTVIVVVGDHGEGLGEHLERWHGNMLYNTTLQVPLIVSMPSTSPPETRVATPVSTVDIAATALDCLAIKPAKVFGGRSLKPALLGQSISAEDYYSESDNVYVEEGWSPLRCLVRNEWKYIQTTKPELYNVKEDPAEMNNLAATMPELVDELEQRLREMESRGIRHEVHTVELSGREQRILAGLGYAGSRKSKQQGDSDENLPDIKDSAAAIYEFQVIQELYWRRQKEAAVTRLQNLVEAVPHYMGPQLMVGRVLETEGKLEEAKQYLQKILQVDSENKEANARVGKILASEGKYHESLTFLHKALDPDAKGIRSTIAAEALPYLLDALKKEPNSVDFHYVAAKMLRAQGRDAEAKAHMRDAEIITARKKEGVMRRSER